MKGDVWKCHYVSPLTRGAIKRSVNNINEGRGLISFLLVDYSNLLKRESGIKWEHSKNLILFSNPRDKIRKLLTTGREYMRDYQTSFIIFHRARGESEDNNSKGSDNHKEDE